MSALHGAATIFIDFENALANTDNFVCSQLYKSLSGYKEDVEKSPVHSFFEIIDQLGEDYIPSFCNTKTSLNPLRDLADISVMNEDYIKSKLSDGLTKNDILDLECDIIYQSILAFKYKLPVLDNLKFTSLADSLRILSKDLNMKMIYVYVRTLSGPIHKVIYDHYMSSDKVTIVTGNKKKFLQKTICDLYVFNDVMSIEYLPVTIGKCTRSKSDVLLVNSDYNKNLWYGYFMDGDNTHTSVCEKFHVNVAVMK